MAPTDCCGDTDASCASSMISGRVAEPGASRLLPTTRSPLHHGTDPDLSALAPLPPGVAATGLDLSPVMGPASAGSMTSMAKRKLRGSPARGGGSSPASPMAARLSRGFPPSLGVSREQQQGATKRVSTPPAPRTSGGGITGQSEHQGASSSPSRSSFAAAPGERQQQGEEGREGKEEEIPALASLGSVAIAAVAQAQGASHLKISSAATSSTGGGALKRQHLSQQQQQQQQQPSKKKQLNDMMAKAKKASDNIRLLLHAKRCEGGSCKEPGCASARALVDHMQKCHLTRGCNPKCMQAKKMLRHYADCNRKRALGGRYCLVCSLVARSAISGGGGSSSNSNVMALSGNGSSSGGGGSFAGNPNQQRRQPLGYLGPGTGLMTVSKTDSNVQQQQQQQQFGKAAKGSAEAGGAAQQAAGPELQLLASPVAISRLRRGSGGSYCCGTAAQRLKGLQGARGAQQQRMGGVVPKDGKFFRPLPRTFTRRGSWGGYDRARFRRTRFDSIPEEVTEDEEDGNDEGGSGEDETSSDAGSTGCSGFKSTEADRDSSGSGSGGDRGSTASGSGGSSGSDRAKTLLTSISL